MWDDHDKIVDHVIWFQKIVLAISIGILILIPTLACLGFGFLYYAINVIAVMFGA
jgi:hypothetical protein